MICLSSLHVNLSVHVTLLFPLCFVQIFLSHLARSQGKALKVGTWENSDFSHLTIVQFL